MNDWLDCVSVPAPSEALRSYTAGDPLGQRGALIQYGHILVPGVSSSLRYARVLALACAAIDLSRGFIPKRRAVEALFMYRWRGLLADSEDVSFYTRGRRLASLEGDETTWATLAREYVKITFTDQIGYSLRSLGLVSGGDLTKTGSHLSAKFIGKVRAPIEHWLARPSPVPRETLPGPECTGSDAIAKIVRQCLYGGSSPDALWRKRLAERVKGWSDDARVYREGMSRLAGTEFQAEEQRDRVRAIWRYEQLRAEATQVVFPHVLRQLLDGKRRPEIPNVVGLRRLAKAVPLDWPYTHDAVRGLVRACRSSNPVRGLCLLAEGVCHVERDGTVSMTDIGRARDVLQRVPVDDQDPATDVANTASPEDEYSRRSYRSYQLWNLWCLECDTGGRW